MPLPLLTGLKTTPFSDVTAGYTTIFGLLLFCYFYAFLCIFFKKISFRFDFRLPFSIYDEKYLRMLKSSFKKITWKVSYHILYSIQHTHTNLSLINRLCVKKMCNLRKPNRNAAVDWQMSDILAKLIASYTGTPCWRGLLNGSSLCADVFSPWERDIVPFPISRL